MSGMGSSLQLANSTIVAAFRSALIHQGIIALLIYFLLAMLWVSAREWLPAAGPQSSAVAAEPAARRLLRIGFGVLWLVDGLLQAQPAMPLGLASNVTEPAAAGSPGWIRHLVDFAATGWSYHPVNAAAAAVWIQVGLGLWLLTAVHGPWSRLAGLASAGWGLAVWVFGEAFGGLFAPGASWLFGAPGAALLYVAGGLLVALPARAWLGDRLGRGILAGSGLFFAGMAVLQAWPGRGFWQGATSRQPGNVASMVAGMAQAHQPGFLAALVRGFGSFAAAHGFAVNLVTVAGLALVGMALLSGRPALLRPALVLLLALCAADWVLIQDMGVFGGLGTDPNSMIPTALITVAGFVALTRAPSPSAVPAEAVPAQDGAASWRDRDRVRPGRLLRDIGAASPRTVGAVAALGVAIIGVIPMATASASTTASPIIAQALDGSSAQLNFQAPAFRLANQDGRPVSLASLHGKVVLLTFLDPVCTSDCPVIAQEFRQADQLLASQAGRVELVAVVSNPIYNTVSYLQAFDRQENLAGLHNWDYLTGPVSTLRTVWRQYGIADQILPACGMIGHSDLAYVIDRSGRTRTELNFDPGPGTASSEASFAGELATAAQQSLGTS